MASGIVAQGDFLMSGTTVYTVPAGKTFSGLLHINFNLYYDYQYQYIKYLTINNKITFFSTASVVNDYNKAYSKIKIVLGQNESLILGIITAGITTSNYLVMRPKFILTGFEEVL